MAWDDNDESDYAGFDTSDPDDATVPCPFCGEEIYEEAQRCAECGRYLSDENAPSQRKPWWIVVGALVCIVIVLAWVLGMM